MSLAPLLFALALQDPASAERPAADPATYLAGFRDEAVKPWPGNRTLYVVCHGHSVPAGYFKTPDVRTFDSYPHLLHVGLNRRYPHAVTNVMVTAIGGENSESGAARFERDVLSLRPDVVTIDYGLNDRGIGLDRARAAWTAMIEQCRERDIEVILLTPTPDTRANTVDPDDPLNRHADQIRKLAAEHGVALVDSLDEFEKATAGGRPLSELMSQVNHPNRAGHELVAASLVKWFPPPRP